MKIYPAIEVKNGHCVKLRQGLFHDTEIYANTPTKIAVNFQSQGASGLHIVDLNGVISGHIINEVILGNIIKSVSLPVQIGGGIKTIKDIEYALLLGASQVVIGSKAVENPIFVKDAISLFGPDKIVIAMDVKGGMVSVDGWEKITTYNPVSFAVKMKKYGVNTIIYKDVFVVKNQLEHNLDIIKELTEHTGLNLIVAGGISSLIELETLNNLHVYGAIIGKALYENKIDLRNAIDLFDHGSL